MADFGVHFFGNTLSNRSRGNASRLRVTDQTFLSSSDHHGDLRKLSGFTGTRLTGDDHDLVVFNGFSDFVSAFADRKAFLEFEFRGNVAEHFVSYLHEGPGRLLLGGSRFLGLVYVFLFLRCIDLIAQYSQIRKLF